MSRRQYVRAVLTFAVALVALLGVLWAVGSAQSGRPSGNATGDALATVIEAALTVLPASIWIVAGMIAIGAAVTAVGWVLAARSSGGGVATGRRGY